MKINISKMTVALTLSFALVLILAFGCSSNQKEISSSEFTEKVSRLNELHSAQWYKYLGVKNGNAYIEYGTIITSSNVLTGNTKPKVEIYFTEYSKLSSETKAILENHGKTE